jgi:hypothetical protein
MFRGNYKPKDASGNPILYSRGDVVLDQGKVFQCTQTTSGSPILFPERWKVTAVSNPFHGPNPPISPIENQIWVSDSGVQYIYFKDPNGYQWVET